MLGSLDSLPSKLDNCDAFQTIPFVAEKTKLDSPLMPSCFEAKLELTLNLVLVLVLNKDALTIKRMLTQKASVYPGIYSNVRGYNLTQENAGCLRLQPHLYPSRVETGLGRGDELSHS